jgi:hypothetical protein
LCEVVNNQIFNRESTFAEGRGYDDFNIGATAISLLKKITTLIFANIQNSKQMRSINKIVS